MSLVDNLQTIITHVSDSVKSAVAADANTAPAVQSTNNVSVTATNPSPVLANVAPVAIVPTTVVPAMPEVAPPAPPVVTPEVEASIQNLWTVLSDIFNGRKTLEDVLAAEIKGAIDKVLTQSEWGKEQNDKGNPDSIWNRTQR